MLGTAILSSRHIIYIMVCQMIRSTRFCVIEKDLCGSQHIKVWTGMTDITSGIYL